MCLALHQPAFISAWQARAASAKLGTLALGLTTVRRDAITSPFWYLRRSSAAADRAALNETVSADPSPKSRRLPLGLQARHPRARSAFAHHEVKSASVGMPSGLGVADLQGGQSKHARGLRPTIDPTFRVGLSSIV